MRRSFTRLWMARQLCLMAAVSTYFWGCEDVITVDLRDTESQIVIEGILTNAPPGGFFVSRTTDFYNPNAVELVSGAMVLISNDFGRVDTLNELRPGRYNFQPHSPLVLVQGWTYHATVTVEGQTYTASTTMPDHIRIDSLRAEYQEGGGIGTEEDEGYRLHVYFQDVAERADYARLKLGNSDYYYLYDGRYSDGNVVDYEYFFSVFQPGDFVFVQLLAMDRTMYYYFLTLDEVWAREDAGNFLDATPANPNTNWSGGALGYFGAFNVSTRRIKIPESGE